MASICTDTLGHEYLLLASQAVHFCVIQLRFQIANKTSLCVLISLFVLYYLSSGTFLSLKSQGAKEQSSCLCVPLLTTDSPSVLNIHWNQVSLEVKDQSLCLTLSDTQGTAQGPRAINQHFLLSSNKTQRLNVFLFREELKTKHSLRRVLQLQRQE